MIGFKAGAFRVKVDTSKQALQELSRKISEELAMNIEVWLSIETFTTLLDQHLILL